MAKDTGDNQMGDHPMFVRSTHDPTHRLTDLSNDISETGRQRTVVLLAAPPNAGQRERLRCWVGGSSEVSGNAKNLSPIDDGGEDKAFLTKVGNSTEQNNHEN